MTFSNAMFSTKINLIYHIGISIRVAAKKYFNINIYINNIINVPSNIC